MAVDPIKALNPLADTRLLLAQAVDRVRNAAKEIGNPGQFISNVTNIVRDNVKQAPTWSGYISDIGQTKVSDTGVVDYEKRVPGAGPTARGVAKVGAEFVTGKAQQKYGYGVSPYKFVGDLSKRVAEKFETGDFRIPTPGSLPPVTPPGVPKDSGLSPLAAAALATGIPMLYHTLTEKSGPITQGLRPRGYKAVAPVSKEEDPTGKTPRNLGEEAALRFLGGQSSQMLPYKEFIKERPDVMPSTIADYRRYVNRKPEAGKRIDVDPERQTFTAFGGAIKGTARGLNDPEIRVKGMPFTASATLGTAAGLGTIAAGVSKLNPGTRPIMEREGDLRELQREVAREASKGVERTLKSRLEEQNIKKDIKNLKQARLEGLNPAAKEFQNLGAFKEPALLLGGTLAAVGTAAVAKKLFQKAEQERIKKEDPLQYKKYKRGDYTKED